METRLAPWLPEHLIAALELARSVEEPSSFEMSVVDYADVRKFGRDHLDIESDPDLLRTGRMCSLLGTPLYVRRDVPVGVLQVLGEDGALFHRTSYSGGITTHHRGSFSDCRLCVAFHVLRS